jgi:probable phosphoglycerate mutase
MPPDVYLVRHGETEWSASGRHTGRTDIPLTRLGEEHAAWLAGRLRSVRFTHVFTSPRLRARRTCELAGWGAAAVVDPDLAEWDYGDYEGLRTAEILKARPGWSLFRDGCPNGESPGHAAGRADGLIARLRLLDGKVALFSHGHFGRVLGARWAGLPVEASARLGLDTASLGILGFERGDPAAPVISLWNERPPAPAA